MSKPTKWHVHPAKTQISLGIRPDWSESSLSAWRKLGSLATHWAHSEDSDQTGRMPRLIWVFAGRIVILLVLSRCHDAAQMLYTGIILLVFISNSSSHILKHAHACLCCSWLSNKVKCWTAQQAMYYPYLNLELNSALTAKRVVHLQIFTLANKLNVISKHVDF